MHRSGPETGGQTFGVDRKVGDHGAEEDWKVEHTPPPSPKQNIKTFLYRP